jgi:antitoxin (DNA-binding transcriptional repressor) of toxin-antitoxin stability system
MKTAKLSDVKNELSRYVDLVRHGETVRILVRRVPVADIVPVVASSESKGFSEHEILELERDGVVRRGRAAWTRELERPGPRVRGNAGVDAVLRERREGR